MAKYHEIVERIEDLIRRRGLAAGDPLPSERELARQFKVAYGTVRMANDFLIRKGVIERHQGRGTYVAPPPEAAAQAAPGNTTGARRRLGLVAVEMGPYESPYLRSLTFTIQRLAMEAGYELIVEQMELDQLVQGKFPRMVRRQSVDGLFLYGWVQPHHVQFMQQQPLPILLVGNRPVPPTTPQVRVNAEDLAYQLTRQTLKLGRWPVWFDADPSNVRYTVGQEMLAGHRRAIAERNPDAPLHLCSVRMNRIEDATRQLMQADVSNAAFIVQDWSASMLMLNLATRDPRRLEELLIVPLPFEEFDRHIQGPNVVTWHEVQTMEDQVAPAVQSMIDCLEGRTTEPQSMQLEFKIRIVSKLPRPRMSCQATPRPWHGSPDHADSSQAHHAGWL